MSFRRSLGLAALLLCVAPTGSAARQASDEPPVWVRPYTGPRRHDIDASSLTGKVLCGYQGWFRAPGDPTGGGWFHWSRDSRRISADTLSFEMWPDMTQYSPAQRYPASGFTNPDGSQAALFSSANARTVERHFDWRREYEIDGVLVQRFLGGLHGAAGSARESLVLSEARPAANRTGRVFVVEYDMSGTPPDRAQEVIRKDWKFLVDVSRITDDPRYLKQNGKLVPDSTGIPRLGGDFLRTQFQTAARDGITQAFVAMFDEVDEGTAIFKVTNSPPSPGHFVTFDGKPSDYYLRLTGKGTRMIHAVARRIAASTAEEARTRVCAPAGLKAANRAQVARPAAVTAGPAVANFLMAPVRVHLLRSSTAAGTSLTDSDIERIFRKVNAIWLPASVHLWVESIVEESPASLSGYETAGSMPLQALRPLRHASTIGDHMFNVYYIHNMEPNGIYIGPDAIFIKDTSDLRPVAGGIDEPLPRVTAHELGHAMGLPHRQDTFNLLASGTTGTSINAAEIRTVRARLSALRYAVGPGELMKSADALRRAGRTREALRRYRAVTELPGSSPVKVRAAEELRAIEPADGGAR